MSLERNSAPNPEISPQRVSKLKKQIKDIMFPITTAVLSIGLVGTYNIESELVNKMDANYKNQVETPLSDYENAIGLYFATIGLIYGVGIAGFKTLDNLNIDPRTKI